MLIRDDEVVEALSGHGGELYEKCLSDLVRAEGRRHNIPPTEIDCDYRVSMRDGGCDIRINFQHDDTAPRFIPGRAFRTPGVQCD